MKNVDERGDLDRIIDVLELKNIIDSNVSELSGGELQRVAIAATVLKDANVYLFDEPTSYLDIKQRMKIARFIKELANERTAVMVIEHDLIILDYMTDMIHLMYGKEGAYGVVSGLKTTKAGINVYLSGYLKEENVRFRDEHIKFQSSAPTVEKREFMLTQWPCIHHKLGKFSLDAEDGKLYRGDVVGILGQNGIGKTTFVKILAGQINTGNDDEIPVVASFDLAQLATKSKATISRDFR